MRFLFVGSSPYSGGAETHFVSLAQALLHAGHAVAGLARQGSYIDSEFARMGIPVEHGPLRNMVQPSLYSSIVRSARRYQVDVLVTNFGMEYWPVAVLGRLLGIRTLLFRHRIKALKPVSNYALPRLASHYFVVSEYARRIALADGIPERYVDVLHNPIDMEHFRRRPQRRAELLKALNLNEEAVVVGYCGRLLSNKGIFTLLEASHQAMAREVNLHCVWVGDDVDGPALRAAAAASAFADRHRFVGYVRDPADYYSVFSMLAFPSIAEETFGRVSVEAQACAVPVLGSDHSGIRETLLPGGTGRLLPAEDVACWRDAILDLCDPTVRQRMAATGRSFVEQNFSYRVIAERLATKLAAPRSD